MEVDEMANIHDSKCLAVRVQQEEEEEEEEEVFVSLPIGNLVSGKETSHSKSPRP